MSGLQRVLMVAEPGCDGVFLWLRSWVRHLRHNHPDITVDVVCSSRRAGEDFSTFADECSASSGAFLDLGVSNAPEPADLPALGRLHDLIRRRRPQLIHAHSSKAGGLARLLSLLPSTPPVIYSPHAYFGMGEQGGAKETFFNAIETVFGFRGLTLCCSEDEKEFAARRLHLPSDRIKLVHHGLPETAFHIATAEEKAAARRKLGLPSDARLLVSVGRDSSQKNYPALYAALAPFLARHALHFAHAGAGSGQLRKGLPLEARPQVTTFENLSPITPLHAAADGMIMTSHYEGLSLAMLEALAAGLPLILPDAPGFRVLRHRGFREVRWISHGAALETDVHNALSSWLSASATSSQAQSDQAKELFLQSRQYQRLLDVYHQVAEANRAPSHPPIG